MMKIREKDLLFHRKSPYFQTSTLKIMQKTLILTRIFFFTLFLSGGWLAWHIHPGPYLWQCIAGGGALGVLALLLDITVKGFSLRGLTSLLLGLLLGSVIAYLLTTSPFVRPLEKRFPEIFHIVQLALFLLCMYVTVTIVLRSKNEWNVIIPFIRFSPQNINAQRIVIDSSGLIDGRIVGICKSGVFTPTLVVPRFVIQELHRSANVSDPLCRAKGRKGLKVLSDLRRMAEVEVIIDESSDSNETNTSTRLIHLAQSLGARIVSNDYNLGQQAEFYKVKWVNINALAKALNPGYGVGETFEVELVKSGKEPGQAVGYLSNGSMVVVNDGEPLIGSVTLVETMSIIPSGGGKMIFSRITSRE